MSIDYHPVLGPRRGLGLRNLLSAPVRRKVFVSHYHGHKVFTDTFLRQFGTTFVQKTVGTFGSQSYINSTDSEYVINRIRAEYIGDSTVTVVLIGPCTHSRRFVDWEIKGSLRQSADALPNGLIGILMPNYRLHLPPRFEANWIPDQSNCYARLYNYPTTAVELQGWIEDAFFARTRRAHLIKNTHDTTFGYNRECKVCRQTH